VPTTRIKLSHDLPRVRPWAQQGAPPRPTSGLGLSLGLGRSQVLTRPRPRPQEKSPPRPTSASDRLRCRRYIITLSLASCLRLRRNKTGVPSKVTPVTGNDGSARASMTSIALKPPTEARKRQQGSMPHRQLCFYRAQGTSPTATLARVQGSRRFSTSHIST
jgi:hypothetical protein